MRFPDTTFNVILTLNELAEKKHSTSIMDYSYLSLLYVLNETEWPGKCFIRIEINSIIKYPWMEVSEPRASHHTSGLLFFSNISMLLRQSATLDKVLLSL